MSEMELQRRRQMAAQPAPGPAIWIYLIRHAEKPFEKFEGVTIYGAHSEESLIPRGWERAGALVQLFAPIDEQRRSGFWLSPEQLIAPKYATPGETENHRTYETLVPLAELLGLDIDTPYKEKNEKALGESLSRGGAGVAAVVLIAWEHTLIRDILTGIPILNPTEVPPEWPDDRFDVCWVLQRIPGIEEYFFADFPQLLLAGDQSLA